MSAFQNQKRTGENDVATSVSCSSWALGSCKTSSDFYALFVGCHNSWSRLLSHERVMQCCPKRLARRAPRIELWCLRAAGDCNLVTGAAVTRTNSCGFSEPGTSILCPVLYMRTRFIWLSVSHHSSLFTCGEAYRSRRAFYFHFGGEGGKVNTDLIPTFCNIWSLRSQLGGEGGKVYTDLSRHFVIFGPSAPVVRRFSQNHHLVVKEVRLSQRFVIPPHPTLCMGSLKPR